MKNKRLLTLSLISAFSLNGLSAHAQSDVFDEKLEPIINSRLAAGYQADLFSEKLGDIDVQGSVFNVLRGEGLLRLYDGFLFGSYSFLSQPVKAVNKETGQDTGEKFSRLTHNIDGGLGYLFTAIPNRLEVGPFLGVLSQINNNDQQIAASTATDGSAIQSDQTIYYNTSQTRFGFGGGLLVGLKIWKMISLRLRGGYYPISNISNSSTSAEFPTSLNMFNARVSLYAKVLPYLGVEVGSHHQWHMGETASKSAFSANWNDVFANISFEPEILFKGPATSPTPVPMATPAKPEPTPQPTATPGPAARELTDEIMVNRINGSVNGLLQSSGASSWDAVSPRTILKANDAIRTNTGSRLVADYNTKVKIALEENTTILIKEDRLVLSQGNLSIQTPSDVPYQVKAYKTNLQTQGTKLNIMVKGKSVIVSIVEGSLTVDGKVYPARKQLVILPGGSAPSVTDLPNMYQLKFE